MGHVHVTSEPNAIMNSIKAWIIKKNFKAADKIFLSSLQLRKDFLSIADETIRLNFSQVDFSNV